MAGVVAGAAKLIGRPVAFNSKCVSFCFIRHLSAESGKHEKPKKPATHFLLYLQNVRNELDRNNPGIKAVEKVKIASQMYKDISDEDRQNGNVLKSHKGCSKKGILASQSGTPGKPEDVKTKELKTSSVTLTLSKPKDDGGSKIDSYFILMKEDDGEFKEVAELKSYHRDYIIKDLKIKDQSVKLLEDYKEKIKKWRVSLSPEEKQEIKSEKEKKNKRKLKKLQKANNKPRRHVSAYTLYVSDQLKAINLQSMTSSEKLAAVRKNMSVCAEKWKAMSEKDKEVFTVQAEEAHNKYEQEMQQWEQNMLEEGKRNLIRKRTLKKQEVTENKTKREAARAAKSAVKKKKTKTTKSAGKKKSVSKKSGVKSAMASKSATGIKTTKKKKVHFEESGSKPTKKDFFSSDSE